MGEVIGKETEKQGIQHKNHPCFCMHPKCRNALKETDIIADRHTHVHTHTPNTIEGERKREREVHLYKRHAQSYTHTLVIVPVQAMRSLSDYRRVIEW